MLFKKNHRQVWFQNRQNIEKIVPENKKAQNVVFNLKGRISLLFYCVKHIHGQFKTYLKSRNIRFKQLAKTIPTVGKSRDILFKTILFCIL
jgi:predicted oxidoreductase (fatty acid repression mutant protein)